MRISAKKFQSANRDRYLEIAQNHYNRNREKCQERHRSWYANLSEKERTRQLELAKARSKQWVSNNRERFSEGCSRRYYAQRDQRIEYVRRWQGDNRDKCVAYRRKRKAAIRTVGKTELVTAEQWQSILNAYGNRCVYCNSSKDRLTQDHVTPLSRGGTHTMDNIVPACQSCNSKKHANPPPTFQRALILEGL
jgi:5-methylcytosine-specific restriction endonuclease McrA